MSNQQQIYRVTARTSFNDIKPFSEAIPVAGPHEVLLQIKAVALNYRDLLVANGRYPFPVTPNVVPVSDCCAVVIAIGTGVDTVSINDTVLVTFDGTNLYGQQKDWNGGHGAPVDGFLRQYAAVQESFVVRVPPATKLSYAQLASLVCTGTTAWNALYGLSPTKPGDVVLVQGTGGVAMTVLALAKAAGCTVIVTSSSDEKLRKVKEQYRADYTINYKTVPAWGMEAAKLTGGKGVDFVVETGGAGTIAESFGALTMGGKIAVIGGLAKVSQDDMPNVALLALSKGAMVRGITIGPKSMLEDLVQFAANQNIAPPIDKVFAFADAIKAYEYMTASEHMGKVCIEL